MKVTAQRLNEPDIRNTVCARVPPTTCVRCLASLDWLGDRFESVAGRPLSYGRRTGIEHRAYAKRS